jgi:hypothetical protein
MAQGGSSVQLPPPPQLQLPTVQQGQKGSVKEERVLPSAWKELGGWAGQAAQCPAGTGSWAFSWRC